MSQGSLFDSVQDRLFDPPATVAGEACTVRPTLAEQSAAAQEVHDLWADRLTEANDLLALLGDEACTVPPATRYDGDCRELVFYRCRDCLSSFTGERGVRVCSCGGNTETVGTLRGNYVYSARIACDTRCQSATRNHCKCSCEGRNHGRDVYVEHCEGVAKDDPSTPAKRATAEEWRTARAAALELYHRAFADVSGSWMPADRYWHATAFRDALRHARKANSHAGRMRKLAQAVENLKDQEKVS